MEQSTIGATGPQLLDAMPLLHIILTRLGMHSVRVDCAAYIFYKSV